MDRGLNILNNTSRTISSEIAFSRICRLDTQNHKLMNRIYINGRTFIMYLNLA